ncbi:hypothetical protein BvCmsNSNP003_00630 [Escherichia coli]|nr:hypothetical protein BvCmsNSNP003_00630 [Escherichia coli]GDN72891.1 hypothetical protein BvCmsNSNP034_03083 [Escherichia coli]
MLSLLQKNNQLQLQDTQTSLLLTQEYQTLHIGMDKIKIKRRCKDYLIAGHLHNLFYNNVLLNIYLTFLILENPDHLHQQSQD